MRRRGREGERGWHGGSSTHAVLIVYLQSTVIRCAPPEKLGAYNGLVCIKKRNKEREREKGVMMQRY